MNQQQPHTVPPAYFDHVYLANRDPWHFETSPYERDKYAVTLDYGEVFEIGCSLGVLTALLAPRCGQLLAVYVSEAALAQARQRCAALRRIDLQLLRVPKEFPSQQFDLILVSEAGYYWSAADLARTANRLVSGLAASGQLLLVHWTPLCTTTLSREMTFMTSS
ncbi:SAM-dependent methyltransferase [Hymenobacter terrenus]|uniref:SAM-dependent methyltransferase n=1 Tax=Hymenobacter terrenus TaxID=1629124 RepID=UPI000697B4CB|nr:SAM-dependent methyltransferase [Hymenobacter terrenus]